jgi:hypothetical protein
LSGPDIFLSYARTDRDVARIFAETFVHEGFTVWWDASLHSGETFDEVIEQNLRDAKAVVVLWSPRSVASRWVRAEATQADRRNKLAPAIIEQCDRPIIFELTHAAELAGWAGDTSDVRWRIFMEDLRHLIERSSGEAAAQPPAAAQPSLPRQVSRAPTAPRHPLRPGSDEVIFANRRHHEAPPVQQSHAVELQSEHAVEADGQAEVHCLEMDDEALGEQLYVIDSAGVKIGRTAPADIVLSHKSISREHCMIGIANDELLITDLNSTNGTCIDGERIARASILPVGSELRLGQVSMKHTIRTRAEAEWRTSLGGGAGGLQAGRVAAVR